MRSLEFSLERLGLDHIDIVYAHDVDVFTHGSTEAADAAHPRIHERRLPRAARAAREGAIKAFGAGINEWEVAEPLAREGDFDVFLLAGRYTLLEQEALESFLPYCVEKNIGVVIGGPFNSGILATGPKPGALLQLRAGARSRSGARARTSRRSARRMASSSPRRRCVFRSAIPPSSASSPAGRRPAKFARNAEMLEVKIPAALWRDLKAEGLLRADAPTPR